MWEEEKDSTAPEVKEETVEYLTPPQPTDPIAYVGSTEAEKHWQVYRDFKIACDNPLVETIVVEDLWVLWTNLPTIELNIEYAIKQWKVISFARYKNDIQISWKKVD